MNRRDATYFETRAVDAFNAGFTTKTGRADAAKDVNRAFEILMDNLRTRILDRMGPERIGDDLHDLYWGLPSYLHNWKEKHATHILSVFPDAGDLNAYVGRLVELRAAITSAEIRKVERKTATNDRAVRMVENIADMVERRQAQFDEAIDLHDRFGNLPVSATPHWVVNQYGHGFVRVFWYLDGRLTPLNIILAAAEEIERRQQA